MKGFIVVHEIYMGKASTLETLINVRQIYAVKNSERFAQLFVGGYGDQTHLLTVKESYAEITKMMKENLV